MNIVVNSGFGELPFDEHDPVHFGECHFINSLMYVGFFSCVAPLYIYIYIYIYIYNLHNRESSFNR